ncbi:hypothetical protein KDK_65830 [Dictyobacter kobayashii]|uniref:Uroporphyrinogen decarboxylase (URO-D) domain-containing protein n=1 Tax=Dictyobacter kobayashii TaxID=2014872 RepID=A0A402AUT4_9CHLR|nr:uroporphyrinogen decarboxylase family protein [Dictyobacter kobayashii]GCE22783.1 hypothetical protein KDK_65830 [Dictyobacter kobayashii]
MSTGILDLDKAWNGLKAESAVQGNLDPVTLLAPWAEIEKRTREILERVKGRPGHIFNLGHGILPGTPVENVQRLVDFVHEYTASQV